MKKTKIINTSFVPYEPPEHIDRPDPNKINCKYDRWPETIPVLDASDLCWNYSVRGRHDLIAWLDITFDAKRVRENPKRRTAKRMLEKVLAERLNRPKVSLWRFLEEVFAHKVPPLDWQAAAWNETMARLGFDVSDDDRKEPHGSERYKRRNVDTSKKHKQR